MPFFPSRIVCLLMLLCPIVSEALAESWPQFRGPRGDGTTAPGPLAVKFGEGENVTWKVDVPGKGHSSPVVADGLIWLTTAIAEELTEEEKKARLAKIANPQGLEIAGRVSLRALAFDQGTGEKRFDIEIFKPERLEPIHHTNSYASPTPVLTGGKVLVHFGTYGSACIDATRGEVLWRSDELKVDHQNGPGSSPIVWGDLMIAHYDGTDKQFVAALRIADGKLAWLTERSGKMNEKAEFKKAYCTPIVVRTERGEELVSPGADWVYGYDPATGKELWKAAYGELGFSTVPRPVIGHGMAYVCTSFMRSKLLAVKLGGSGDVTSSHVAWTSDSQITKKPSMTLVGEELYMGNDTGIITCFDALTGKEIWRERIGGNFSASPLLHDGLIYFFSEEGKATVIRAGRKFEVVAVNELGDGFTASPAVVDGALFLRSQTALYRIDPPK